MLDKTVRTGVVNQDTIACSLCFAAGMAFSVANQPFQIGDMDIKM